jgi:hypothetical protein
MHAVTTFADEAILSRDAPDCLKTTVAERRDRELLGYKSMWSSFDNEPLLYHAPNQWIRCIQLVPVNLCCCGCGCGCCCGCVVVMTTA